MKVLKLIIFSVILIVLLVPTFLSSWWTASDLLGNTKHQNPEYVKSPFYTSDDEIGFLTEYCKKNNYFGRTTGTEEQRLSDCIDEELRMQPLVYAFSGVMYIAATILLPIFLIYLYFYVKWLRRNYFKRKNV